MINAEEKLADFYDKLMHIAKNSSNSEGMNPTVSFVCVTLDSFGIEDSGTTDYVILSAPLRDRYLTTSSK